MSIAPKRYEAVLRDFRNEVRSDPNADFTPFVQRLMEIPAAELRGRENLGEQRVINTLLLALYEGDSTALNRQITKLMLANAAPGAAPVTEKVVPSERGHVFLCLCDMLSLRTKEDFAGVIAMCEKLRSAGKK